jgi:hypothetical protein
VFATNIGGPRLAELELQHRLRARAEDRIRTLKDTGLANLPLHDFAANQVWLELVLLASDLLAWTQTLALTGTAARRWNPSGCACDCCTSPADSCAPAVVSTCDYPAAGPGHSFSSARTTGWPLSHPETTTNVTTTRTGNRVQARRPTTR